MGQGWKDMNGVTKEMILRANLREHPLFLMLRDGEW